MKKFDCIVIGTGAAGFNAACQIKKLGKKSVAIVTEGVNMGTSRNTGSDKQTYYKLGLSGNTLDSVHSMAQNLFAGGCVDGDNALCEAALSVRCFMNLASLGVPFPVNRYGEYVGYKTDHDPFERATSAGPLTSKFMTESLENQANELGIEIFSDCLAVKILKDENGCQGVMCIDVKTQKPVFFKAQNVVLCTGGPAGIYYDSVFPESQTGSTGLAIRAGASLQNMTEWQYGLASVNPRWNVSGTYMQVLPRFVSVDNDGNEYEFVTDYFKDDFYFALSNIFLKGYQWPFDSKKVLSGSSVIDLLCYREKNILKRRVYLDFMHNPKMLESLEFEKLDAEAFEYLEKADALFGKPIDRLEKMNAPAIDLYMSKGVDISKEYLEIALCAQHNNGGIAVDKWWQTDVTGLYAAGECAGTHGVSRPGGSALNAGQVGSLRAAQHISASQREGCSDEQFDALVKDALKYALQMEVKYKANPDNVAQKRTLLQKRMSEVGSALRNKEQIQQFLSELDMPMQIGAANICDAYRLEDMIITQKAVLLCILDFADEFKGTRGSSLYTDKDGDKREGLSELFRFKQGSFDYSNVQQIKLENDKFEVFWRKVREIPSSDDFFENVWKGYRENGNVY